MKPKSKKRLDSQFSLEDVKILGGTDEDFKSLSSMKDDDEEIVVKEPVKFDKKLKSELTNGILDILKEFGKKGVTAPKPIESDGFETEEEEEPEAPKAEIKSGPKKPSKKDLESQKISNELQDIIATGKEPEHVEKMVTQKPEKEQAFYPNSSTLDSNISSNLASNSYNSSSTQNKNIIWKYPVDSILKDVKLPNRSLFTDEDDSYTFWHEIKEIKISDEEAEKNLLENKTVPCFELKKLGMQFLENEANLLKSKTSELDESIYSSGTLTDRVALMCESVENNPLRAYPVLKKLFDMISSKSRREYLVALYGSETIKHVKKDGKRVAVVNGFKTLIFEKLLPLNGESLRYFHERDLRNLETLQTRKRNRLLALYAFEDYLKSSYKNIFIHSLIERMKDNVTEVVKRSMRTLSEAIITSSENENIILSSLVDKFNSSENQIASYTQYLLNQIIEKHPVMSGVIVNEVENFLFTKTQTEKAKYFAVIFFNQLVFDLNDSEIAVHVLLAYMKLFTTLLDEKPDKNPKFKKDRTKSKKENQKDKKLSKAAYKAEKAVQKKAEKLTQDKLEQRHKFIRAILTGVGRAYPFAVAGSEKTDQEKIKKLNNSINDLFRLIHNNDFGTSVRATTLLSKMAKHGEDLNERLYTNIYNNLFHSRLPESTKHHSLYLNGIFQTLSRDENYPNRIKAILKRMLSLGNITSPCLIAGILVVAAVLLRNFDNLHNSSFKQIAVEKEEMKSPVKEEATDMSKFDSESEDEDAAGWTFGGEKTKKTSNSGSKVSESVAEDQIEVEVPKTQKKRETYDPNAWNPLYSGSQFTPLWEVLLLRKHYHPGIAHLADDLLNLNLRDEYKGDPLEDFTLIKFLDRFSYKNPKDIEKKLNEKKAKRNSTFSKSLKSSELLAVTSNEFIDNETNVNPTDVYLQNYFKLNKKIKEGKLSTKKKKIIDLEEAQPGKNSSKKSDQSIKNDDDLGFSDSDISDDEFDRLIASEGVIDKDFDFIGGGGAAGEDGLIEGDDDFSDVDLDFDSEAEDEDSEMEDGFDENSSKTKDQDDVLINPDEEDKDDENDNALVDKNAGTIDAMIDGEDDAKQLEWESKRRADSKFDRNSKSNKSNFSGKKKKTFAENRKRKGGNFNQNKKGGNFKKKRPNNSRK